MQERGVQVQEGQLALAKIQQAASEKLEREKLANDIERTALQGKQILGQLAIGQQSLAETMRSNQARETAQASAQGEVQRSNRERERIQGESLILDQFRTANAADLARDQFDLDRAVKEGNLDLARQKQASAEKMNQHVIAMQEFERGIANKKLELEQKGLDLRALETNSRVFSDAISRRVQLATLSREDQAFAQRVTLAAMERSMDVYGNIILSGGSPEDADQFTEFVASLASGVIATNGRPELNQELLALKAQGEQAILSKDPAAIRDIIAQVDAIGSARAPGGDQGVLGDALRGNGLLRDGAARIQKPPQSPDALLRTFSSRSAGSKTAQGLSREDRVRVEERIREAASVIPFTDKMAPKDRESAMREIVKRANTGGVFVAYDGDTRDIWPLPSRDQVKTELIRALGGTGKLDAIQRELNMGVGRRKVPEENQIDGLIAARLASFGNGKKDLSDLMREAKKNGILDGGARPTMENIAKALVITWPEFGFGYEVNHVGSAVRKSLIKSKGR